MANILVFGTSTTYGAWDSEGGWVQRLRHFIDLKIIESNCKIDYLIYNLGVSGDKTTNILNRFEKETEARLDKYGGENIILFHVGINDCIFNEKLNGLEISPDEFEKNLSELIHLAKKYASKIVIIGSMPVDKRVDPMPWAPGRSYKNEFVSSYNEIMQKVGNREHVEFVEIYKEFIDEDYSKLLSDGVHMNDEGHKKIYEKVKDFLIEKNIIKIS